jgi:serine phosphatase RsbU (regulator of sigma subunit)
VVLAGLYFGLGLYKSRGVNHAFLDTVRQAQTAAGLVLAAETDGAIDEAPAATTATSCRPWLAVEDASAYFVLRRVEVPATPVAPADSLAEVRLTTLAAWSSPDTPDDLLSANLYGAGEVDTVGGLFQTGGRFYLAAALARKSPGEAMVSEVYVPVDSLYLGALAERVGVDIRVRSMPGVRISSTALQFGVNDDMEAEVEGPTVAETPSTPGFTVSASFGEAGTGLFRTKRLVARQFLPVMDWRHEADEPSGATALMTLSTSPALLLGGIVSAPYVLSSNIFAIGLFLAVLLLFTIAESSAVRTGRSIIEGILDDAKGLAAAAGRFGSGDLDYRIPEPGKDELGQLASAFNAMAADLKLRQEELIEKERLEADLTLARRIQERLLPQGPPSVPGLEVAGVSVPSLEVGGDLFYFLPLKGDRLGLAIGDVSGKSIPAALLMSNALAILRAETRLENEPADVLTQMNALIAEQVESGRFLTFLYGVVDPCARKVRYACAGHNPPLVVRADGVTEWLEQGGLALGILPDTTYTAAEIALRPGDVLVLYSDGLTEASRPMPGVAEAASPDEEEYFGEERLLEATKAHHTESATEILDGLVSAVHAFAGDAPQSDDLTVVVVKMRDATA